MAAKKALPERWEKEGKAAKAVQVAFDLTERVQTAIRQEAIDRGINPSDRAREILGLPVISRPKRLRLSISLAEKDFVHLAAEFGVEPTDRIAIKQMAAERLIQHADESSADDAQSGTGDKSQSGADSRAGEKEDRK